MRSIFTSFAFGILILFSAGNSVFAQVHRTWQVVTVPGLPVGSYNDLAFLRDTTYLATSRGIYARAGASAFSLWDTARLRPASLNISALAVDSSRPHSLWALAGDTALRHVNSFFIRSGGHWNALDGPSLGDHAEPGLALTTGDDGAVYPAMGAWGPSNLAWNRYSAGTWQATYSFLPFNLGINKIVVDRRSRIWALGTGPTFVGLGDAAGAFSPFRYDGVIYDGAADPLGSTDSLYLATQKGLAKMIGSNGHYTRIDSSNGLPVSSSRLRSLRFMTDGTLLIGTESKGLLVRRGHRWWVFGAPYLSLQAGSPVLIKRIMTDEHKGLHLVTPAGIVNVPTVIAQILPPDNPPCPNQVWVPNNHSLGLGDTALTFRWLFGDGSPEQAGRAPSHSYAAAGSYLVRLIARNLLGVEDTAYMTLPVGGGGNLHVTSINTLAISPDSGAIVLDISGTGLPGTYTWYRDGHQVQASATPQSFIADSVGQYWVKNQGPACALQTDTVNVVLRPEIHYGEGAWAINGRMLMARDGQPPYVVDNPVDPPHDGTYNVASIGHEGSQYSVTNADLFHNDERAQGYFAAPQLVQIVSKLGVPRYLSDAMVSNYHSMALLLRDSARGPVCLYGTPGRNVWVQGLPRHPFLSRLALPDPASRAQVNLTSQTARPVSPYRQTTAENGSLATVLHRNGQDVWLLVRHDSGGRLWVQTYLHRFTGGQVVYRGRQNMCPWVDTAQQAIQGLFFRISQDGRRLVARSGVDLFIHAFDNLTGRIQPLITLSDPQATLALPKTLAADFSPSRRYLYTLEWDTIPQSAANSSRLIRYDMSLPQAQIFGNRAILSKRHYQDMVAWPGAGIVFTGSFTCQANPNSLSGQGLFLLKQPEAIQSGWDSLLISPNCQEQRHNGLALPNITARQIRRASTDTVLGITLHPIVGSRPAMLYSITGPLRDTLPLRWELGEAADTSDRFLSNRQAYHIYRQAGTYTVSVYQGGQLLASRSDVRVYGTPHVDSPLALCPGQVLHTAYVDSVPEAYRTSYTFQGGDFLPKDSATATHLSSFDTASASGTYTVQTAIGCYTWFKDTLRLRHGQPATLAIQADTTALCLGDTILLRARSSEGNQNLVWQNTRPSDADTVYLATTSGTYTLTQQTTCGPTIATLNITERSDCIPPSLGVSQNLVTPNGDGQNDLFAPAGWQGGSLHIFNRFGGEVDAAITPKGFDLGNLLPGVYYFRMEPASTQPILKGWVEVVK